MRKTPWPDNHKIKALQYNDSIFWLSIQTSNRLFLMLNNCLKKSAQFTKMELPSAATGFVPFEMAQIMPKEFVPTELAQIPSVLFFTGWSNHQLILNRSTKKNAGLMRIRQSASSCAKNQTWKLFVLPSIAAWVLWWLCNTKSN